MKRSGPIKRTSWLRPKRDKKPNIERIPLPFARPCEVKKEQPAVKVMKDGREICNQLTKAGRDEYERRKFAMRDRQGKRCCLEGIIPDCPGFLAKADTTFEHEDGRGFDGAHRDDRIEILNPKTGKMEWINGAAHSVCNSKKGSRRFNYNEAI